MNKLLILFLLLPISVYSQNKSLRVPTNSTSATEFAISENTGSWEKLYPPVPVQDYSGIWFRDSIFGFITGDKGNIIKTTDGGLNWKIVSGDDPRYVTRISSNDSGKTLIAVGLNGFLKISRDYGETWSNSEFTQNSLWSVKFRANEIWVSGIRNTLLKSTNNGESWDSISTGYPGDYWEISFSGDSLAAIATDSGSVLMSWDGCKSWEKKKTEDKYAFYAIKFVTPYRLVTGGSNANLYYSIDTGRTWAACEKSQFFAAYVEDIQFRDSLFGYTVLNNELCRFEITDGGISWKLKRPVMGNQSIQFVDSLVAFNIGYGMEFWKTTDGGTSWSQFILNQNLTDIHIGENKIFITSENTHSEIRNGVWLTDKNFKKLSAFRGFMSPFLIEFVNPDTGFIFNNHIHRTTDGGENWELVDTLVLEQARKVKFFDNIGYFAHYDGLMKTTDRGKSWFKIAYSNGRPLCNLDFIDKDNGFYLIDSIYRTSDGGSTWRGVKGYYLINAKDIAIIDINNMWITSWTGSYHSQDSGKTWISKPELKGEQLLFLDNKIGFMLNSDGILMMTTDAGATWNEDKDVSGLPIRKIRYFVNKDNSVDLYIMGNTGLLLRKHTDIKLTSVYSEDKIDSNVPFRVYPNPFQGHMNFDFRNTNISEVELELYSILGERVLQKKINPTQTGSFELKGLNYLSPGIYFLRLNLGNISYTHKILKTK